MLLKEIRKELLQTIGGLSVPSKMPCFGWSIPAAHCRTGAKLAKEKGTICSKCYALKFRYNFSNVKGAMQNRLDLFNKSLEKDNGESWIKSMAALLEGELFFRFFDSGDLQSLEMLDVFCRLAKKCNKTKFWLPTKEHGIVSEYIGQSCRYCWSGKKQVLYVKH